MGTRRAQAWHTSWCVCAALTSCASTFASMEGCPHISWRLRCRSGLPRSPLSGPLALQVCGNMFEVDARYNPVKPIGKGAYGIVCSAQNDQTDEKVCVWALPGVTPHSSTGARSTSPLLLLPNSCWAARAYAGGHKKDWQRVRQRGGRATGAARDQAATTPAAREHHRHPGHHASAPPRDIPGTHITTTATRRRRVLLSGAASVEPTPTQAQRKQAVAGSSDDDVMCLCTPASVPRSLGVLK